ncbi:MAG TPA: sodium:proton exchanger [Polyangiaceae bacterium]|jgi:Kef-type K+ transport system membrane component KefB
MSSGASGPKGFGTRLIQALLLALVFGMLFVATRAVPEVEGGLGAVAAVGFLLLAGTLASELVEAIGLPHLSGYIAAGVVAGPHVLKLLGHEVVERLAPVNTLALSLIALAGGAELKLDLVKRGLKSLAWATLVQSSVVLVFMTGVFISLRRAIPFVHDLTFAALVAVALLWGTLSVSRSPSAVLGILAQLRPRGPLTDFTLTFVMTSDVVVVVMMAAIMAIARPLLEPGAAFSLGAFGDLGHELLGSVALGTTLGLVLAVYLRLVGRHLLLVFLALGFGLSEILHYLRFDPLLTFLTAGFVVQNLTAQGEKLLHAIEKTGSVVYVVFFATAGAHLDIPLLKRLWPIALTLAASRAVITFLAARLGSRLANDPPVLRRWGWCSLVSQAGLTLGLSVIIEREFPSFGAQFRALAIATVALNEVVGPVLFKFALESAGEVATGQEAAIEAEALEH